MNIKHSHFLAGTLLLVLAIIASAVVPAMGAPAVEIESTDGNFAVFCYDFSEEEMKAMVSLSAEERQVDFMEQLRTELDEKVAAGKLTKEEADDIYASFENFSAIAVTVGTDAANSAAFCGKTVVFGHSGPMTMRHFDKGGHFVTGCLESDLKDGTERFNVQYAAGFQFADFSEEELDALKNMTDDERKEFFDSRLKAELDTKIAAGELTQEEADEIYAAHSSGVGRIIKFKDGQGACIKMTTRSEEEFSTFEKITTDDKEGFFLSQFGPVWMQRLIR